MINVEYNLDSSSDNIQTYTLSDMLLYRCYHNNIIIMYIISNLRKHIANLSGGKLPLGVMYVTFMKIKHF